MLCPYCNGKTEVVNSRHKHSTNQVWRRRSCRECLAVFTSFEVADLKNTLAIENKGSLSPFDADRLFISIYNCMRHRKVAHQDARALYETILNKLLTTSNDATISRDTVVNTSISVLRRFDQAASVQYAAYHPTV